MKKQLISFVLAILPMVVSAYDVKKDGIYYNLNNSKRTAEVASAGNTNAYSGVVEIPESFNYDNTAYSVTSIGANAFKGCTNLVGVVIPSTVKSFGEDTFFGCTGLKYILSLIETPFEIPKYTFYYNSPSEGVKPLPCMLFVVGGSSQLWNWKRYEGWNVNLYSDDSEFSDDINGVKTKFRVINVKERTCKMADGFGDIPTTTTGVYIIPESTSGFTVTGIGYGAFMDCSGLTGIIIPNTVTDIELIPFMNCTGLTSITIPSSVKNIEGAMFKLTNIKEVKVDPDNIVYDSRDNCNAIIETSTNTLVSGCKATTIPSSITAIADLAFEGIGIEAVDIPEQMTAIGSSAFRNCNKLTSIIIPSGVTTIGSAAFQYCDNLTSVTMKSAQPIAIDENTFSNHANATLYVPYRSKAAYEAAEKWKDFKEIVEMPAIIDFADVNVKNLCVANWDTDGDGELSEAEAEAVTNLGIVFKNNATILSFTELKYFVGLTSIDDSSFYGCSGLTSVTIPNSVRYLGLRTFSGCSNLTSVEIPNSVTSIGSYVFADCISLTSVSIPISVTSISNGFFFGCSGLTSVEIPNSVTSIGDAAFYGCISLTSVTIPNGVKNIGDSAFEGCNGLSSMTIPKSVTSIGSSAFSDCSGLTSVTIPNSVWSIGQKAFENCIGLTSIEIPKTVTTFGYYAFSGCSNLTSVKVGMEKPLTINDGTFTNRSNAILYVPLGCKAAYKAAIYWKEFKEIVEPSPVIAFADDNVKALCVSNWDTDGDGELSEAEAAAVTDLGRVFENNSTILTFDELVYFTGLTSISNYAFYDCQNLSSIILPCNITDIGKYAFYGCSKLPSINIPSGLKQSGSYAFYGCNTLKKVIVSDLAAWCEVHFEESYNSEWGNYDFSYANPLCVAGHLYSDDNTEIIDLIIPDNVKSIENDVFFKCDGIKSVSISENVRTIGKYAFYGCHSMESVTIGNNVESIGYGTFMGCTKLSSVDIPNSVTVIGENTFSGCVSLSSVTIGNGLTTVGNGAFSGCTSFTSLTLNCPSIGRWFEKVTSLQTIIMSEEVTKIESSAFYNCSGLETIVIPNSLKSIGISAFGGCSKLNKVIVNDIGAWCNIIFDDNPLTYAHHLFNSEGNEITDLVIPDNVNKINNRAFNGCSSLTSLTIPNSVSSIGDLSFANCTGINTISLSDGVESIGHEAFLWCSSLTSIRIPKSVMEIGVRAFDYCNKLTIVTVERETPVDIQEETFSNRKNATLYVPAGSKVAYEEADYWKEFGCILEQGTVLTENNSIYAEDASVYIGYAADLQIKMSNEDTFTAYQFDLVLPNGITLAKDEKGKYIVTMSNRYSDNTHQVTIENIGNNTFRFVCVSLNTSVINGNDGTILTVSQKADGDIAEGELNATIKNVILTTADETKMKPKNSSFTIKTMVLLKGDADGDGEIDVTDVVSTINYIIGNPSAKFNFLAADLNDDGEVDIFDVMMAINLVFSQKNSSRSLTRATSGSEEQAIVKAADDRIIFGVNEASRFTAFQFDVELTNAVELKDVRLNADSHHDLQFVRIGQDTYRVIGISMDNSTLTTNGNDFVELRLSKECDAQISNIVFVTPEETKVHFAGSYVNLTDIRNTTLDQSEEIFDLSGCKIDAERSRLPKGVYIINNKKVVKK